MSELTIKQAITLACEQLAGITDSTQLDSEVLLAYVFEQHRTWLHTWPEKEIDTNTLEQFNQLIARRKNGEPVAHIIGEQEFWSIRFKVTTDTLIPRADTERLVELALEHIPEASFWNIADLGTGSGAIALAIAKERPSSQLIATDASMKALTVAQENARLNQLNNIRFVRSTWFEDLDNHVFDMIVSNPPYIAEGDPHLSQGDVRFEPLTALTSGPEGLDDITHLVNKAPHFLKPGGWLILEHGYDQAENIMQLMTQAGFVNCQDFQDYGGNPRVAIGQYQ
ncbi:MAG: peptide chain release factor N(5)-glutamine methyltransferase [Gammaproteobacteria bacterium]